MAAGDEGGAEAVPGDGVGTKLAIEMLATLKEINKNMVINRELMIELRDSLDKHTTATKAIAEATDELCGRHEVLSVAADILGDIADSGKTPTLKEVWHAIATATDEVFGDDEDEDEGGGGGGGEDLDPSPLDRVPVIPRRRDRR